MSTIEQEARAEAGSRLYDGENQQVSNIAEADAFFAGYIAGASRPVTEEEIERAARALNKAGWTCSGGFDMPGMYDECEDCRRTCERMARAALDAAREVGA